MKFSFRYYLLKCISFFVCLLPYPLICHIGRRIGYLYFLCATRPRNRGIDQAMQGLDISFPEAKCIMRKSCIHLGQTLMEILYTPALTPKNIKKYISIEGLDNLRQAVEAGRGVIAVTAHVGNWEWMPAALFYSGFPTSSIAQPQPNPHYDRVLNEYRRMCGTQIFNRGTTDIIKAARALKQGNILGMFSDQDAGNKGVMLDFMGREALTPTGAALFADKLDSAIVPIFIFHRQGGGHRLVIDKPIIYQRTGDHEQDIYNNTKAIIKVVEDKIKLHPDEWIWFLKRWESAKKYHTSKEKTA
ncbi:MAG: lpxL 2 [Firmicutes bacterium]|nr:lpxL 2 [Bacillota bacterium]